MGWFSRIEQPLVRDASIAAWKLFAPQLDLREARKARFSSLHDCFIRELKEGARPIDARAQVLISPCDAIVGACGRVDGSTLVQAKGLSYTLDELLGDRALGVPYRNGVFVTLRLTPTMYHRFHAPHDARIAEVTYIAGDTWNVNPPAVKRIERLYCRNERAVVPMTLPELEGAAIALVPVAAILVAGLHLYCLNSTLTLDYSGPRRIACAASVRKGEELGYFRHGSTIIVLAGPEMSVCESVREGVVIRMGEPLLVHHRTAGA